MARYMARYINADEAIKEIDKWIETVGIATVGKGLSYYAELLGCIEDTPTADVAQVVHGHWIKTGGYVCGDYAFECSNCHDERWEGLGLPNRAKYCQCCGAKMDEEV